LVLITIILVFFTIKILLVIFTVSSKGWWSAVEPVVLWRELLEVARLRQENLLLLPQACCGQGEGQQEDNKVWYQVFQPKRPGQPTQDGVQ